QVRSARCCNRMRRRLVRVLPMEAEVLALAIGKTQQEITAARNGARPNHVGAAIARHKRAGRIEERDGKLYATQSTATEQHATVLKQKRSCEKGQALRGTGG